MPQQDAVVTLAGKNFFRSTRRHTLYALHVEEGRCSRLSGELACEIGLGTEGTMGLHQSCSSISSFCRKDVGAYQYAQGNLKMHECKPRADLMRHSYVWVLAWCEMRQAPCLFCLPARLMSIVMAGGPGGIIDSQVDNSLLQWTAGF
jgi:hypothetical protein